MPPEEANLQTQGSLASAEPTDQPTLRCAVGIQTPFRQASPKLIGSCYSSSSWVCCLVIRQILLLIAESSQISFISKSYKMKSLLLLACLLLGFVLALPPTPSCMPTPLPMVLPVSLGETQRFDLENIFMGILSCYCRLQPVIFITYPRFRHHSGQVPHK